MQIVYDSNDRLGRGGYGSVFPGKFEDRHVAVKRVALIDADEKEEKALQQLDHPNVVKLYHVETDGPFKYFALELCEASLDQLFLKPEHPRKYKGPMLPGHLKVLLQLASGLEYIHSKKLIHRDIKPGNVLISVDSSGTKGVTMKWADFGLSKFVNERGTFTMSGVKGSDTWMAPELLKLLYDEGEIQQQRGTVRSDIFSEGLVFGYLLSAGKHLFGVDPEIQSNILKNEPINVTTGIQSASIRSLILRMLESKPERRIKSSDVVEQLKSITTEKETKLFTLLAGETPNMTDIKSVIDEGVDINCVNQQGLTPLLQLANRCCVLKNLIDLIKLMIENGANVNSKDTDGWNALQLICRLYEKKNLIEIVQLLTQHEIDVNNKDHIGNNVLLILLAHYPCENLIEIIQLLIKYGIDLNCQNKTGWNALHRLCQNYNKRIITVDLIELIIKNGMDMNCKTERGWNALHILCKSYNHGNIFDIIRLLIEQGIDINCQNDGGWNALHILCRNYKHENLIDIIRCLIDHGIDVNCKNSEGCDALHMFKRKTPKRNANRKNNKIIELLSNEKSPNLPQ